MQEHSDLLRQVKPRENRALPPEHDLPHAVAFYFHDELAQIVVDLVHIEAVSVRVDLEEHELESFDGLEGEALWQWLHDSGRQDVINDLTYRQLTAAVLSDAAHFVCESLLASGKGKMAVALALLRKPFKESLLLLEWLCVDPSEFLNHFHGESIHPYLLNRMSKEKRRDILRRAAEAVDFAGVDDDLLWLIRYDKQYLRSFETLWTKATHLVTSVEASTTERSNLNFVFSTEVDTAEQWKHYYFIVPLVLYYFVLIAEKAVSSFVVWDDALRPLQLLRRQLAFTRYVEEVSSARDVGWDPSPVYRTLGELTTCLNCGTSVNTGHVDVDRFWLAAEVTCPVCGASASIWDLVSNEEAGGTADGMSEME